MQGKSKLTHVTDDGEARMVDITAKTTTVREARARGAVRMRAETLTLVGDSAVKKGDVLNVARLAGIMAAKRTPELIPLCHGLQLTDVQVDLEADQALPGLRVTATAKSEGKTGVEMEALTAVSVACLTVYDMCKAVDRSMVIEDIHLILKTGGKSGTYRADKP